MGRGSWFIPTDDAAIGLIRRLCKRLGLTEMMVTGTPRVACNHRILKTSLIPYMGR